MSVYLRNKTKGTFVRSSPQQNDDDAPIGKARRFKDAAAAMEFLREDGIPAIFKDGKRLDKAAEDVFWQNHENDSDEEIEAEGYEICLQMPSEAYEIVDRV